MRKIYNKNPVAFGIIFGQGLFLIFILLEYFFAAGIIVDSCLRIVFGIVALLLMKVIYRERFTRLFTEKISKSTWVCCIPFFIILGDRISISANI